MLKRFFTRKYQNSDESSLFKEYFKHGGTVITFEVDDINIINNNLMLLQSSKMHLVLVQ